MIKKIQNEDIYFEIENTGKPKLVFFHGYNSNTSAIRSLLNLKRKYDIIALDFPGCGKSSVNNKISMELYQKVAWDFISSLEFDNLTIMGHSLGGASALYCEKHPKVKQVIFLSTYNPFVLDYFLENFPWKEDIPVYLLPKTKEQASWCLNNLYGPEWKEKIQSGLDRMASKFLEQVKSKRDIFNDFTYNQVCSKNYQKSLIDKWKEIKKPTYYIQGDKDILIPYQSAKKAYNLSGGSWFKLENIGHVPILEDTHNVNKIIEEIINI